VATGYFKKNEQWILHFVRSICTNVVAAVFDVVFILLFTFQMSQKSRWKYCYMMI